MIRAAAAGAGFRPRSNLRTGRRLYAWFVTSGRAENSDDAPDFERPCAVYYRLSFAGFMPGAQ